MDTNLKHFNYTCTQSHLQCLPSCVHIPIIWHFNQTVYLNLKWSICVVALCDMTEINLEDGGRKFLRNVHKCLFCYSPQMSILLQTPHPRRWYSSFAQLREPQITTVGFACRNCVTVQMEDGFPSIRYPLSSAEICGSFIFVSFSHFLCLSSYFLLFFNIHSSLPQ